MKLKLSVNHTVMLIHALASSMIVSRKNKMLLQAAANDIRAFWMQLTDEQRRHWVSTFRSAFNFYRKSYL